ncbi:MAG TPA: hypothetical protein VF531_08505 [Bacillota bacterium]
MPQFNWKRANAPVIPTAPGTWKETYTANPDLIELGNEYLMYYRGTGNGHDRIGVMRIAKSKFDGFTWEDYPDNPILDVGAPGSFDDINLLDPSAAVVPQASGEQRVYLYYSAVAGSSESIGLAISKDGIHFEKYNQNPVLKGRCPEVVYRDGQFYLFYVKENERGGYNIHAAMSTDGIHFTPTGGAPVLTVGAQGSWESQTVTTPRLFFDRGLYYMVYAGDDRSKDDPHQFGLATSMDLIHWQKYGGNPIFSTADRKHWDNCSIWYGTAAPIDGGYIMWYEACDEYRGEPRFVSAVGAAVLEAPYFFVKPPLAKD